MLLKISASVTAPTHFEHVQRVHAKSFSKEKPFK